MQKKSTDFTYLKRYWPHLKPHKFLLGVSLMLIPGIATFNLLQPYLLQVGIDQHILKQDVSGLLTLLIVYAVCVIGEFAFRSCQMYLFSYIGQKSVLSIRDSLFNYFLSVPMSYFDKTPQGQINAKITTDVESLTESFASGLVTLLADLVTVIGIAIAMMLLNFQLSLYVLGSAPFLVLFINICRKQLRHYYSLTRKTLGQLVGIVQEHLEGVEIVQQFGTYFQHQDDFKVLNNRYKTSSIRSVYYDAVLYSVIEALGTLLIAFALFNSIPLLKESSLSLGVLVAFIAYIQRFFEPLKELSSKFAILQHTLAALEKIFSVYDIKQEVFDGKIKLKEDIEQLSFEFINFAYPNKANHPVLKDVSFKLNKHETLALVGPTGSGKSTVSKLIFRLYSGYSGQITLNGRNIQDYTLDSLRKSLSFVNQDVLLFSEQSVAFNITLDNPSINEENMIAAAKICNIHHKIMSLPQGYQTIIDEQNHSFSLGESQLISLARAIATPAQLVILDEATAAIDSLTEKAIQKALLELFKTKTVLVIAHRLSTIKSANRILVLHQGQCHEQGTHQELMAKKGLYAKYYTLQQSQLST